MKHLNFLFFLTNMKLSKLWVLHSIYHTEWIRFYTYHLATFRNKSWKTTFYISSCPSENETHGCFKLINSKTLQNSPSLKPISINKVNIQAYLWKPCVHALYQSTTKQQIIWLSRTHFSEPLNINYAITINNNGLPVREFHAPLSNIHIPIHKIRPQLHLSNYHFWKNRFN